MNAVEASIMHKMDASWPDKTKTRLSLDVRHVVLYFTQLIFRHCFRQQRLIYDRHRAVQEINDRSCKQTPGSKLRTQSSSNRCKNLTHTSHDSNLGIWISHAASKHEKSRHQACVNENNTSLVLPPRQIKSTVRLCQELKIDLRYKHLT